MKTKTCFGNGVYVNESGNLQVEFRHPGGVGVMHAKSLKESLDDAIAFAERILGLDRGVTPLIRTRALN